jgi:hypothetical protein
LEAAAPFGIFLRALQSMATLTRRNNSFDKDATAKSWEQRSTQWICKIQIPAETSRYHTFNYLQAISTHAGSGSSAAMTTPAVSFRGRCSGSSIRMSVCVEPKHASQLALALLGNDLV